MLLNVHFFYFGETGFPLDLPSVAKPTAQPLGKAHVHPIIHASPTHPPHTPTNPSHSKMAASNPQPRLLVLYGSQTGTAQDLAEELARKGKRRGFQATAQAFDGYDVTQLPEETLVLVVISTTGDGEEPDNMKAAWRFLLRKSLPVGSLGKLRFATFGLGDSSYPKFNAVARRLHTRLKQLGAQPFAEVGLGDDQSAKGVLGDFDAWCREMWPALHALYPALAVPADVDTPTLEPVAYACRVETTTTNGKGGPAVHQEQLDDVPGFYQKPHGARNPGPRPFLLRLLANKRLTPEDWFQETRHLEWDIQGFLGHGEGQAYEAGDVAYLYPENPPSTVAAFVALLTLQPHDLLHITCLRSRDDAASAAPAPPQDLPVVCTVERLVRRYLDIEAVPKRVVLEQLALVATSDEEKEKLLELASPEGADLYHEYCYREKRSLVEVLLDFPSARPSLDRLLTLVPRLRPRAFSIASSCHPHGPTPQQLHLCVAVVAFRTPYKRQRRGLCSSYLASLPVGSTVPLWIRPGSFVLPKDPWTPLIMVGPGTGVAPFKAMVEERAAQRKQIQMEGGEGGGVLRPLPPYDWLFFGCRKERADFYYREEMERYVKEGGQLSLSTAFSRDLPEGVAKVYVTHRLKEQAAVLWRLLGAGGEGGRGGGQASFFVAGSAKRMPTDVLESLKSVAMKEGGLSEPEALRFLDGLVRARRYCVESWSV